MVWQRGTNAQANYYRFKTGAFFSSDITVEQIIILTVIQYNLYGMILNFGF